MRTAESLFLCGKDIEHLGMEGEKVASSSHLRDIFVGMAPSAALWWPKGRTAQCGPLLPGPILGGGRYGPELWPPDAEDIQGP